MLTTANPEWDRMFRLWRQHGMSIPDTVRHAAHEVSFESYPMLGFNYRMTDIQAAVGRKQLERLPDLVARRRALADRYHERFWPMSRACRRPSSRTGRAPTGRATACACPSTWTSGR